MNYDLHFRWTISRGRDTYGYNICTLLVDDEKVSACNGGGYDMEGSCFGDWIASHKHRLRRLRDSYYGLTWHDPNYNPNQAIVDGQIIAEAEKGGAFVDLDRYQAFFKESSPLPTSTV